MEGRELTDRYRLEKILKSTPATTVMAAVEAASGRPVVIKLVHPRSAAGLDVARSRFAHWAATVRALSQPAFPAILEAGFDAEGSAFLVVERLPGRSFETAPPSPGRAAALLAGIGEALAPLAKRGLAHGNLAADNLWLAPAPQGGEEVKLLGLGTAPFRGDEFGEAAIAGDAAALADLRERFAPAEAEWRRKRRPRAEAAAAAESAAIDSEPEEEVLSPVDEDVLHAPPEPPPVPIPPAAAAPAPPPVEPGTAPGLPRALWGGLAAAAVIVLGRVGLPSPRSRRAAAGARRRRRARPCRAAAARSAAGRPGPRRRRRSRPRVGGGALRGASRGGGPRRRLRRGVGGARHGGERLAGAAGARRPARGGPRPARRRAGAAGLPRNAAGLRAAAEAGRRAGGAGARRADAAPGTGLRRGAPAVGGAARRPRPRAAGRRAARGLPLCSTRAAPSPS